jgi:hypothetical protein
VGGEVEWKRPRDMTFTEEKNRRKRESIFIHI